MFYYYPSYFKDNTYNFLPLTEGDVVLNIKEPNNQIKGGII
jgi:hypothetical protein